MMKHTAKGIAAAGATTGLALALVGVVPLAAQAAEADTAPTAGAAFDKQAHSLLDDEAIQAVGVDGDGNVVVYATADQDISATTQAFIDASDNVKVTELDGLLTAAAATDLVGGYGYGYPTSDNMISVCSVGFSAWTPEGKPGFVSAGHCTDDGAGDQAHLSRPSSDTAAGGTAVELSPPVADLTFSQFGGPGNSPGADQDLSSIDFSAWELTDDSITMLPEVTDWTTADQDDLSLSTETITAVGEAQLNKPIERSGRTTGHKEGTVIASNVWFRVGAGDGDTVGRYVHGFATDALADRGDSGGPMWQGSTAVGVASAVGSTAAGDHVTFGADLQDGLKHSGGYTLMLKIAAPEVTSDGENVAAGSPITGTAPAGTKVVITPASGDPITVTADDAGNFSFPAPEAYGEYAFSVVAKDGYNVSAATDADVTIVPQAPAIASPANGSSTVDKVTKISGTGVAGATVTLGGDLPAAKAGLARAAADIEVTVGDDGTWTTPVDFSYGSYTITAAQSINGTTSATSSASFSVVPAAPAITSPEDGLSYVEGKQPKTLSGTGVDGATVTVTVGGLEVGTAVVEDGTWSVDFPADLAVGSHTLSATQAIEGASSAAAEITVTVTAVVVEPTETPTASAPPTSVPNPDGNNGGNLAATGASDVAPAMLGGLGLLIAGAALIVARRLRAARR